MLTAQSCPTLCNPTDCSLPVSSVCGISSQEYWSGLPFPPPGDLPNPGIKPGCPALQADSLPSESPGPRRRQFLMNIFWLIYPKLRTSHVALVVKNPLASAGDIRDASLLQGLRRSPGEGNGNPLQYSCLENPMDRGAWQATIHRVA